MNNTPTFSGIISYNFVNKLGDFENYAKTFYVPQSSCKNWISNSNTKFVLEYWLIIQEQLHISCGNCKNGFDTSLTVLGINVVVINQNQSMLYSPERGGSTIKPVRINLPFIPILSYEQECRRVDQDIIICNFVWIADRRFLEKFFTTSVRNAESNTSCVLLTECLTLNN